ncbi:MAG: PadR family transcriptional regulator, partial [Promethearchaeota archaeon]
PILEVLYIHLNVLILQYVPMVDQSDSSQCCPPDCCEGLARGFLNFQILWELGKEELNGQQIAERIAKRRGSKPTPGTIYPALKELKQGKYIEGQKVGRQIIYSLTAEGERALLDASRYFIQAFGDIADDVKVKVVVIKGEDCNC